MTWAVGRSRKIAKPKVSTRAALVVADLFVLRVVVLLSVVLLVAIEEKHGNGPQRTNAPFSRIARIVSVIYYAGKRICTAGSRSPPLDADGSAWTAARFMRP
jgi:hypothetical protein